MVVGCCFRHIVTVVNTSGGSYCYFRHVVTVVTLNGGGGCCFSHVLVVVDGYGRWRWLWTLIVNKD